MEAEGMLLVVPVRKIPVLKYDLKAGINMAAFLRIADLCEGLFLASEIDPEYLASGKIRCDIKDAQHLAEFIVIS